MSEQLCPQTEERIAQVSWCFKSNKYILAYNNQVLARSGDKDYLNYLVVKQKSSAVVKAGVTKIEFIDHQFQEPKEEPIVSQDVSPIDDHETAQISWCDELRKYVLTYQGEILVKSRNRDYLNYLVVKQKHAAVIKAGVTKVQVVSYSPADTPRASSVISNTFPVIKNCDHPTLGVTDFIWQSIVSEITPLAESCSEPPKFTRPRGRPKTNVPKVQGVRVNRMEDHDYDLRHLSKMTIHKIILDFKEFIEENKTIQQALNGIASLYSIPYVQAYNLCQNEI